MLIPYTKLIDANIIESKGQTRLGQVYDFVILKSELKVGGILTKSKSILTKKNKAISISDIEEITSGRHVVIVRDQDALSDLSELIRLNEAFKKGYAGIGQKVQTRSGKKIGKVFDYLIQSDTFVIRKFYVKGLFSERIIASSNVVEMTDDRRIIIKDDYAAVKLTSPAVESSVI